jgi:hypothetical protein
MNDNEAASPEVEGSSHDPVRSGSDFDQISPGNLDSGYFTGWKPDEIGEQTTNNRRVTDDQQVIPYTLQLEYARFQSD